MIIEAFVWEDCTRKSCWEVLLFRDAGWKPCLRSQKDDHATVAQTDGWGNGDQQAFMG